MPTEIHSPYLQTSDAFWLRGNLHTHTTRSDGAMPPQQTIDSYASLKYDFLALSDHNTIPDHEGLDAHGLLLIPANEISGSRGHVLSLGYEGRSRELTEHQQVIDTVVGSDAMAVLCHPNWGTTYNHYDYETLEELEGYQGIEIYNGSIEEDPGSPFALDKWDRLLASGRRIWGLATDDAHHDGSHGRGTCVVRVSQRSPGAVIDALKCGSFYASTGPSIESIEVHGDRLNLIAPEAEAILVVGEAGRRLVDVASGTLQFQATAETGPVFRVEVICRAGRRAWTQPFFVTCEELSRRRRLALERPLLEVGRGPRAPQLIGDLSSPQWQDAASTTAFLDGSSGAPSEIRTEMLALLAEGCLYFGFRCSEPEIPGMKLTVLEDSSALLWTDDGFELFIDVEGHARRYFHLMANAKGLCHCVEQGQVKGAAQTPNARARSSILEAGYTLEIALPLSELGLDSDPGGKTIWGFNAVRNRHSTPRRSTFSFTNAGNHEPTRFGHLRF